MSYQSVTNSVNPLANSVQIKLILTLMGTAVLPFSILAVLLGPGLLNVGGIIGIFVLLTGLVAATYVSSRMISQTSAINDTLNRINQGDFEARAEIITADELGKTAAALNAMCDNTLNLIQSHEERDQIQSSIESLIAEMEQIAAGDLTITASINNDLTGAIASSINRMTEQLRSIVRHVQGATEQVTISASSICELSTNLSHDSDRHANRIAEASDKLLQMTGSFQNVAALTEDSVQVAIEARETATKGFKAVNDTVEGMQRIRDQVQATSKRIKRLGESSQEIGEIVQLISDIADRTSILALNASIQAAMAGDAGQGFAVVAEEVERLAERCTVATKDISTLIRTIQNETGEAIADMEESTREVVAGSQLATQAGATLFEIDSVSNQLVELIQSASTSVLQQADAASQIANKMADVSASNKEDNEKSRQATRSVAQLAELAGQLRDSVARFKVDSHDGSFASLASQTLFGQPSQEFHSEKPTTDFSDEQILDQIKAVTGMLKTANAPASVDRSPSRTLVKTAAPELDDITALPSRRNQQRTIEHTIEFNDE